MAVARPALRLTLLAAFGISARHEPGRAQRGVDAGRAALDPPRSTQRGGRSGERGPRGGDVTEDFRPLNVLFVCVENSCRSQMAEGYARALGGGRVSAFSAGSRPSGQVDPRAIRFMSEAGIDVASQGSKGLEDVPDVRWDFVVTMGCGDACPHLPARHRLDWDLPDPKHRDDRGFREVRDRIEGLVRELIRNAAPDGREARSTIGPGRPRRLDFFERYLTVWVALCMVAGVLLGKLLPGSTDVLRELEFGRGSQINLPIAVLIWLMIYPMMLKIDFASVLDVRKRPAGILVTLFVNWLVKPFSMALFGWLFFKHLFLPLIGAELADQYVAGVIILAAAPCTAMVFVWSYLTDGDSAYTLVQVSLNDLIMLFLFAPIVGLLVAGASGLQVPFAVLLYSVVAFIVIPLGLGGLSRVVLLRAKGRDWFEQKFLPFFHPVTTAALLATLVLIFAFQADNLTGRWFHVLLIAVPILVQVYFNAALVYGLMKLFRVPHAIAAPGALIGASNFFELAVAVAITLFGPESGAALATVVGVLVEVPVMLTVCAGCNRTRHWFPTPAVSRA
jgi:ACR3 family arsenite transporter